MQVLIPMAGGGTRFAQKGYALPKPLLEVNGKPMCIEAALSLPTAQRYCFIIQKEHEINYSIQQRVLDFIPNASFVEIEGITEGQAVTCLLAKEAIDPEDELIIGACDNGMIYNTVEFDALRKNADIIIFAFTGNKAVMAKPEAYGWLVADESAAVSRVSVKVPISNDPFNDPAVVGAFWFKKGKYFVDAAEKMIAENRRINGEFYVDECINDCIHLGQKAKVFRIDEYIGWGTPDDYETYCYWQSFFDKYLPATS